jgi:asparagine synthase (glutamine-hydrolysing)
MCGIVGSIQLGDVEPRFDVVSAAELLLHRGPDHASHWSGQAGNVRIEFAHRRLIILDRTESGNQPMVQLPGGSIRPVRTPTDVARLVLVYNGEIYNYVELREELRILGHQITSHGDTEVLLAAYAQWGERCLDRLNGMFAFAIWDSEQRRLFCARDRFGEKPFYYALDERRQRFAFASEVKALVGMGAVASEPNARAFYRFVRFGEQAGVEDTVWRGVRRLLPATSLTLYVSNQGLETRTARYWDVSIADNGPPQHGAAAERFADLFRDSVRIRLRADVPLGTSLSGGLDSSSVLCQIHALGAAAGQKAFTARMPDPGLDEGRFVELVLGHTRVPGFSVVPSADEFLSELDRLAYHQEEPFTSTSVFASYLVHRLAQAHGVTVMLDGQGADEYLAGYAHYPALVLSSLARAGRWRAWWAERAATRDVIGVDPVPPRAALRYWLASVVASNGSASHVVLDSERDTSFLSAEMRAEFSSEEPRTLTLTGDALKARLYADLMHGHLQELLRYADRNSMAFSREVRLPFLDHRLVELSLSLPSTMLFGEGRSKRVLRTAMRGTVPHEILDRRDKVGFLTPWAQWWTDKRFKAALSDRLEETRADLREYVDVERVPPGSPAALGVLTFAAALRGLRSIGREAVAA